MDEFAVLSHRRLQQVHLGKERSDARLHHASLVVPAVSVSAAKTIVDTEISSNPLLRQRVALRVPVWWHRRQGRSLPAAPFIERENSKGSRWLACCFRCR